MYEGGIRVPMIVWWPGSNQTRTVSDQVFTFWDFSANGGGQCRVKPPENIDGISLLPDVAREEADETSNDFSTGNFMRRDEASGANGAGKRCGSNPRSRSSFKSENGTQARRRRRGKHPDVIAKIENYLKTARTESERWPIKSPAEAEKEKRRQRT
jgi:hypothetical protein